MSESAHPHSFLLCHSFFCLNLVLNRELLKPVAGCPFKLPDDPIISGIIKEAVND